MTSSAPNEPRKKPRKGLSDACRAYGIDGWESVEETSETLSR